MSSGVKLDAAELKLTLGKVTARLVEGAGLLYEAVVRTAMETTDAEACSLYLEDRPPDGGEAQTISMVAGAGFEKHRVGKASYRRGEGLTGTIWKKGVSAKYDSTKEVEDPANGWQGKFNRFVKDQEPAWVCRSLIAVPLCIGEHPIGLLKVENKRGASHFSKEDQALLEVIASTMALAIENRRLSEQTSRKTLSALDEMSGMIASDPGRWAALNRLCRSIVQTCVELFSAQAGSLYLEEQMGNGQPARRIRMVAGAGYEQYRIGTEYELGEGLTGAIWQDGAPRKFDSNDELRQSGVWSGANDGIIIKRQPNWVCSSLIGAPLRLGHQTIGVLKVENKEPAPTTHFSDEELQTLQIIASIVALAVQTTSQMRRIFDQGIRAREVMHSLYERVENIIINFRDVHDAILAHPDQSPERRSVRLLNVVREALDATKRRVNSYRMERAQQRRELLDVEQLVRGMGDRIQGTLLQDGIGLVLDQSPDPVYVRGVPSQLEEALHNLIWNAVEAMEGQTEPAPLLVLRVTVAEDQRGWVEVSVIDNGCGLSPDQQAQFGRDGSIASTKGPDRGLGVRQAYWAIAFDHGGNLAVSSPPRGSDRGTEFTARLPVEPTGLFRLLIIDDNEDYGAGIIAAFDDREDVAVDLEQTPDLLRNLLEAAESDALRQLSEYDYILLDAHFESGESGLDIYRHLQAQGSQLTEKILVISADPTDAGDVRVYDKISIRASISDVVNNLRTGRRPQ